MAVPEVVGVNLCNRAGLHPYLLIFYFIFLLERILLVKTKPEIIAVGSRGRRLCTLDVADSQRWIFVSPLGTRVS